MATLVNYTCKSFIKLSPGPVLKILSSLFTIMLLSCMSCMLSWKYYKHHGMQKTSRFFIQYGCRVIQYITLTSTYFLSTPDIRNLWIEYRRLRWNGTAQVFVKTFDWETVLTQHEGQVTRGLLAACRIAFFYAAHFSCVCKIACFEPSLERHLCHWLHYWTAVFSVCRIAQKNCKTKRSLKHNIKDDFCVFVCKF